jgi:hypothetical protein
MGRHGVGIKINCVLISGYPPSICSGALKTHQETLKCHHVAGMIIARYGRRPKHAKHALNAAAGDCSLGVRVPEMIAESLLFGKLFACLHTANTAPAHIDEPCSQQRVLQ